MVASEPQPTPGAGVSRAGDHDRHASVRPLVEELFRAHQPAIRRYILSMVRDPAQADDLTQDVFLRAHRKQDSLRDPDAALGWLYRIATRICYDRFRQLARQPRLDPRDPGSSDAGEAACGPGGETSLDRVVLRSEMSECVQGYLRDLREEYRQVIVLHDLEYLTSTEIAQELGVSVDAVKIRLHRARRRLQTVLEHACDFSRDEEDVFVCEPAPPPATQTA
jgi:RNA polymerase sigma-70 factor, ECF subfamily